MQGGRKEEEMDVARLSREKEKGKESEGKQERKPFWKEAKREMEDRGGKRTERETER